MRLISHRGKINFNKSEENNKNSIINFLNSDIEMIEIDIQLTKDNQIILCHDNKINIDLEEKFINELTSDYLIKNKNYILLETALNIIKDRKKIYLDLKTEYLSEYKHNIFFKILVNLLKNYCISYNSSSQSIYIASFYKRDWVKIINIPCHFNKGLILNEENIEEFKNFKNSLNKIDYDFLSIDYKIIDSMEKYFNKTIIFCWTINEEDVFEKIIKKNIDGICTDFPEKYYLKLKEINY